MKVGGKGHQFFFCCGDSRADPNAQRNYHEWQHNHSVAEKEIFIRVFVVKERSTLHQDFTEELFLLGNLFFQSIECHLERLWTLSDRGTTPRHSYLLLITLEKIDLPCNWKVALDSGSEIQVWRRKTGRSTRSTAWILYATLHFPSVCK